METRISETVVISRPVRTVFAFAADYRDDPFWRTGVTSMSVIPDTRINTSSVTEEVLDFAGKTYVTKANVVAWEPNRKTAFKSFSGAMSIAGERLFEDDGTNTRFTYTLSIEAKSAMDKFTLPILATLFRSQLRKDLNRLKAILEQT